jgi:hypothetical protein
VIYYGVSAGHRPESREGWRPRAGREAEVVDAAQDSWFGGETGPNPTVEESARVAARLATPSDGATRAGLPVRRSRAHLVPGAFETGAAPEAPRRSAEEIRERMRGYRRKTEGDQGATV